MMMASIESSPKAKLVIVFSGKRKSGKDFVCSHLKERIGSDRCTILTISAPLKQEYARIHGLDYEQLLSASSYKERYRKDMVMWGENKRNEDPPIFCRLATQNVQQKYEVWLISDSRRKTDVKYFRETYSEKALLVRVQADESVRIARGFVFKEGVDDTETECGLDTGVEWDFVITNNSNLEELDRQLVGLWKRIEEELVKAS